MRTFFQVSPPAMSEEIMRNNLFALAQRYATGHGLNLTTVSKRIHGNQRFLERFLEGKVSTTLRIYFQMVDRLRATWPKKTEWPKTVPVPRLSRVPYRPATNQPERGDNGRFLGKKVHRGQRPPSR